jgi:glycosyltransferase involved in cell wall biosynthesis
LPALQRRGVHIHFQSFWTTAAWRILYTPGARGQKAFFLVIGFIRRLLFLPQVLRSHIVFIHREASPLGPPVFEWCIARLLRKPLIFDFDDAIWLANTSEVNRAIARWKYHRKTENICRWSTKISCGNTWLAGYARQYNAQVEVIPTTIDTDYHKRASKRDSRPLCIGWTGTHSTDRYLQLIVPAIQYLQQKHDLRFIVISNQPPDLPVDFEYMAWHAEREIEQLSTLDIGLMPLHHSEWELGKCGFKALQYMAMGIPVVASPVGANSQIVHDGVNGYLCRSTQEWQTAIAMLLNNAALRRSMGEAGRKKVVENYSVEANVAKYFSLFA